MRANTKNHSEYCHFKIGYAQAGVSGPKIGMKHPTVMKSFDMRAPGLFPFTRLIARIILLLKSSATSF